MIFLFAAAGICLPSFPGGYLHPRKTKISHPKNGHLSSPKVLFFGRPIILKGQTGALKKQLRGVLFTPREDEHRIEPEVMMIWFRWFSELPVRLFSGLSPFIFQGCLSIFFVVCSGRPTLENTSCMWRSIASSKPWAIFLKSVPGEEQKLRKSEKNLGFWQPFLWLSGRITWNKKRAVPKGNGRKRDKKWMTWRKKTADLVRKRFFEGW